MPTPADINPATSFSLRVARIDELPSLSDFHRWSIIRFKGEPVGVNLSTRYIIDPSTPDMLRLRLVAHYHTVRSQIIRPLIDYAIEVVFEVDNLQSMASEKDGELLLATGLLSLTLSVGIGALRGMIALGVRNTFLAHYPLPVFRIADLITKIAGPDGDMAGTGRLATIRLADI
ncbi:MAG: hypothetical protein NC342_06685 [Pseudoflavonifractor sp.]|nr:hypothetical protein [Alloprevotella sp.]MCM1117203.1 hypothetical protein [Pseudoflavonifractor sp.]